MKKVEQNYGNAVYVSSFLRSLDDGKLKALAAYLPTLYAKEGVQRIEKRNWRSKVR